MLRKIYSFVRDLVGDGYILISVLAPLLSIAFTLAKAFDMQALGHLRDISYAWAFAPIIIWLLIAYIRRRNEALRLNAARAPKLRCSFDLNDPGCRRANTIVSYQIVPSMQPVQMKCNWLRLRVDSDSTENVTECRGRLIHIKRGGEWVLSGENPILPFAQAEQPDATNKVIHPGIPEFLDLIFVTELNQVSLTPHRLVGSTSIDWRNLFSQHGEYEIRVAVVAAQGIPSVIDVLFHWAGEFSEARFSTVIPQLHR